MRLLVTGGAGYIGSVTTAVLLAAGHEVTVLDDLSTGHADAVPPGARFVQASITDASSTLATGFDGVVHFAAKSLVGESASSPELYWHNNVLGSLALLDAMRAQAVPRIVFSSTAATYGEPADMPITEATPVRPTSPYGASKLAVDMMLSSYAKAYGLAAVSLRYFNVAGSYEGFGERHRTETHLVPNALLAADGGPPLQIFGRDYPTLDGTAIRDYIHVRDLADAHVRALSRVVPANHAIFNLGTGTGTSVLEIIDTVARITGREVATLDRPRRAGDPARLVADGRLAHRELGWRPSRSVSEMVSDAWEFHQGRAGTSDSRCPH